MLSNNLFLLRFTSAIQSLCSGLAEISDISMLLLLFIFVANVLKSVKDFATVIALLVSYFRFQISDFSYNSRFLDWLITVVAEPQLTVDSCKIFQITVQIIKKGPYQYRYLIGMELPLSLELS